MSEHKEIPGMTINTATAQQSRPTSEQLLDKLFITLSDVQDEPKRYIYKPYFPVGKFCIISADPGTGKTKFMDGIAANVTVGKPLKDIPCEEPGGVLFFSREDDGIDHKELIREMGGNTDLIHILGETDEALDYLAKHPLTFGSREVELAIATYKPKLVVFDPYQKYIGKNTDINQANRTSSALAPLITLAKKYDCCIVVISHNNKAQTSLNYKFMGSQDFIGECRSALSVVRDPEHPSECIAIHVKSNNQRGDSIRYRIEQIPDKPDYAKVKWLSLENYTEKDYFNAKKAEIQKKEEEAINDDDPVIQTVLNLLNENTDTNGLRMGACDIQKAIQEYTGQVCSVSFKQIISRYRAFLKDVHGIGISSWDSSTIYPYICKGKTVSPVKSPSRYLLIARNVPKK